MADSYITPFFDNGGRVMVTHNGPHPAELWAQAIVEHIAPINPDVVGHRRYAAQALQAGIAQQIETICSNIQSAEKSALQSMQDRLTAPLVVDEHVNNAVAAIQLTARGSEWEQHFQKEDVVGMIKEIIGTHFRTIQHIERGYHADNNPGHPLAQAFNASRVGA